jgi:hypothetical protein
LKRHVTNHDDPESRPDKKQKRSQSGRTRASQACIGCAEAKLRCEGNNPCLRCERKKLFCRYPTGHEQKSPSRRESLPSRDDRVEAGLTESRTAEPHGRSIEPLETNTNTTRPLQVFERHLKDDSVADDTFQPMTLENAVQQPTSTTFDPGMYV